MLNPDKIYKFRNWDDNLHKRILTHSELYLSSCDKFKDPFECRIPVRYDTATESQLEEIIKKHLKVENPSISRQELRYEIRELFKKKNFKNIEEQIKIQHEYRKKEFGICSFTTSLNNIVLWSLYANSHKGFCVCFDFLKMQSFIERIYNTNKILIDLYPISYSNDFPEYNAYELLDQDDFIVRPLITKSKDWSYENEYRLISITHVDYPLSFDPDVLDSIYLGCLISKKNEDEILTQLKLKNSKIKVFKAKLKALNFGLDFQQIDY